MFESFEPGTQSTFKTNPNYWVTGKPYVDALTINSIDDNTARLNALLSGQIDAMAQLPTAQAKAHQDTGDITVLVAPSPQAMMFYMDTDAGAVQRRQRAPGDQADRRPRGPGRERDQRLRHGRERHRRQGPAVLRQRPAPARAGHRPGQEPAQEGRPGEPDGAPAHVADLPRLRRGGDAPRRAGQGGRCHDPAEAGSAELVLQPVAALPEDGVRRDAVAHPVAQVLLPPVAVGARRRTTRRTGRTRPGTTSSSRRSARPTRRPPRTPGTRCRRSSTTRAAT